MQKCYRCEVELLNSNRSIEHIIPNSCGGKLKSKSLLCKHCNSFFGSHADKELSNQINDLANILSINREKGDPRPIRASVESKGVEYDFYPGQRIELAKPLIVHTRDKKTGFISITAPNKKMLKQVLDGLKRKHPEIDIEQLRLAAVDNEERVDAELKVKMSIGGNEVFRAIAKIAIGYFLYIGGDRNYVAQLLPFIEGNETVDAVWMHYPSISLYKQHEPTREVSHVIKLVGNPVEKILYAYIELFNCHNYIVKLCEDYTGPPIDSTYSYDLFLSRNVKGDIVVNYSRRELLDLFQNKDYHPFEKVKEAIGRVLEIAQRRKRNFLLEKLADRAWNNSFGKYPPGTVITQEMQNELNEQFFKEVMPYLHGGILR